MVAIDTTQPQTEGTTSNQRLNAYGRKEALRQWAKRTQEMLAYRSKQGLVFRRLWNLMRTKRLAEVALEHVLSNEGASTPGVDGITKRDLVTASQKQELIEQINRELCTKKYRPLPVRRVYIPKPGKVEKRPLGIPTIKDRVVQEMLRLILEPIYESKFHPHSYGFRPFRSTHHAIARAHFLIGRWDYHWVIEGDIRKCFDKIHHSRLLEILRKTIKDERIVRLVRQMLRAGCMEDNAWHLTEVGAPQGGIVSPLLANIYLNELDWFISAKFQDRPEKRRRRLKAQGKPGCYIVRYADDFVILVQGTEEQAEELKADVARYLDRELHLELSQEKTLVTHADNGFDFLGFNVRHYRSTGVVLTQPSRKAQKRFKEKLRQRAKDMSMFAGIGGIVHLNRFIIGWGMYYRHGASKRTFQSLDHWTWHFLFRYTRHLHNVRSRRKHYRNHFIPYRFDVRSANRRRGGCNYGFWIDRQQEQACIVTSLAFIPIKHARMFSQLNPYIAEERERLERKGMMPSLPAKPSPYPEYGAEWTEIRRVVLNRDGGKCRRCGKKVSGGTAHVHHRSKFRDCKRKRQANRLDNLITLCTKCHSQAER